MKKVELDMIYLLSCGVNGNNPDADYIKKIELEQLYQRSCEHSVEALIGMVLKQAGVSLQKEWNERIAKAVRKVLLFDAERAKLLSFMEQKGIWYLPLKGVILKEYYPAIGMRQMSDNDILFDYSFSKEIQKYMEEQGYKAISIGKGMQDIYKKEPVYNFEMHGGLYEPLYNRDWEVYYREIKKKLILNSGASYGYHFTDEDFYIYIISHAYKHYIRNGIGIRTLLDIYVYLKAKHQKLDYIYIEQECAILGIVEFEYQNRKLCEKIFGLDFSNEIERLDENLSVEDKEMLDYYFSSGVHGSMERGVKNRVKRFMEQNVGVTMLYYFWKRLFPDVEVIKQNYPHVYKHKLLLPLVYVYRLWLGVFDKKRRNTIMKEVKIINKIK